LETDFHKARIHLAEMLHFFRQLQSFCHLEVIDCSWEELEKFATKKQGDLDSLIDEHRIYLTRLVNKGLLQVGKKGSISVSLSSSRVCFWGGPDG
jgi:gamma-tubulin complex component 3